MQIRISGCACICREPALCRDFRIILLCSGRFWASVILQTDYWLSSLIIALPGLQITTLWVGGQPGRSVGTWRPGKWHLTVIFKSCVDSDWQRCIFFLFQQDVKDGWRIWERPELKNPPALLNVGGGGERTTEDTTVLRSRRYRFPFDRGIYITTPSPPTHLPTHPTPIHPPLHSPAQPRHLWLGWKRKPDHHSRTRIVLQ